MNENEWDSMTDSILAWFAAIRFGVGVLLAISLPPSILYWFLIHPFIGFWRRRGLRATVAFLAVFYLASVAVLIPYREILVGRDLGTSLPLLSGSGRTGN